MLSSIVVPLDGSDLSRTALPTAERVARAFGARITLLTSGWGSTVEELEATLSAEAAALEAPTVVSVVPDTFPATAIAHALAGTEDVVVMATHGRSGIGRALLGSVAEDLLKATDRPVVLLGPSVVHPPDGEIGSELLVTTDGSAVSEEILVRAAVWAKALGLTARVLAVTDADGAPVGPVEATGLGDALPRAAAVFEQEGVGVTTETVVGADPARTIVEVASEPSVAMVAMTTHARTGWERTALGSVAMKVVHDSPSPVLVQKPAE